MVDDEEGGSTVVVLREADGGWVLWQVHIHYDPAHLQKKEQYIALKYK